MEMEDAMRNRLCAARFVVPFLALMISLAGSRAAQGVAIDLMMAVDDYAKLYIDGSEVLTYDAGPAGNVYRTLDLSPGLHDIRLEYANRWGSYGLFLGWKSPSETAYTAIPKANLFCDDASGNVINGLRADYYQQSTGSFTIFGEGPIWHNWTPVYQGVRGEPWAGVFSGWPIYFTETLSGRLLVPEPPPPLNPFTVSDFKAPMGSKKKLGSTLPVKFQLFDGDVEMQTPDQIGQALGLGSPVSPRILLYDETDLANELGLDLPEDGNVGEGGELGDCFRYSDGNWIFNLRLNAPIYAPASFVVKVKIGDIILEPGNDMFQTK